MSPARPLVALGGATVLAMVVAFVAATAAFVLVASDQSGNTAVAAWLGAVASGVAALGIAGAAFIVFRSVRASRTQWKRTAARLQSIEQRSAALDTVAAEIERRTAEIERRTTEFREGQRDVDARLDAQQSELAALSTRLVDLPMLERQLRTSSLAVKKAISTSADHTFWRTQGLLSLYWSLGAERGLPPMRSWAIAPDLAAHLVDLVRDSAPRHVVETGSGVSTVLLAMALCRNAQGHVTALEHDPAFAEETRRLLTAHQVEEFATVLDCPLVPVEVRGGGDAEDFLWYDVVVADLAPIDMLFVDGPPQGVGPLSRFPAIPVLDAALASTCIIILDDAARDDEQTIADRWCNEFGFRLERRLEHERGTIVLRRPEPSADQHLSTE